jgi:hypothetical protein
MVRLRSYRTLLPIIAVALLVGSSHAQTEPGVSSFIDGISKLIEFFKTLDGTIDQQTSVETRQSLARELVKINDSLLVLESNKQLLNESITDPDLDYARVGARVQVIETEVRRLRDSITRIKQFLLVDDKAIDAQLVQEKLTAGLDAKLGSLKQIEMALTNKTANPSAPIDRDALIKEGEDAVKQVEEARRIVSASIKKLRQNP